MEPETELRADPFSILIRDKMVDWCLKICPNQNVLRNENKKYPLKYIGVYLEKITDTEFPIEADIAFNSLTNNGTTITWEGSNNNVIFQDGNCRGLSTFMPHSSMCLRSKDKNESLTIARLLAVPHAVSAAEHQLGVPRPLDGQQPRVLILGPEPGHSHPQPAGLQSFCVY